MRFDRSFLEDDEEEDLYGMPTPALDIESGGLPEEDMPDAPGFTVEDMYGSLGEPPEITPDNEQSFQNFIGEQAGLAQDLDGPLDEVRLRPEDRARADEIADYVDQRNRGSFEQEALADMRADIMKRSDGLTWEDAVFPAIAGFLDAGLNKGRGLGQIAAGTYAGMAARNQSNSQAVQDLGELSLKADQSERAKLREQGMQDYYTHERELGDRRIALDEARENRLANPQPRPVDKLGQEYKQAQIDKLKAEAASLAAGGGKGGLTQDQIIDNARQVENDKYQRGRDAKKDEADAAKAALEETLLPGTRYRSSDPNAQNLWKAKVANVVDKRLLEKGVVGYQTAMSGIERLIEIRDTVGIENFASGSKTEFDALKQGIVSGIGEAANAGVLQPSDLNRFNEIAPSLGLSLSDVTDFVGDFAGVSSGDTKQDQLRALSSSFKQYADPKLAASGLEFNYEDPLFLSPTKRAELEARGAQLPPPAPQQPPAASLDSPPPPAANLGLGGHERLPVTQSPGRGSSIGLTTPDFPGGARRSGINGPQPLMQPGIDPAFIGAPPAPPPAPTPSPTAGPAVDENGKTMRTIVTPDGSTVTVPLSESELQYLLSRGARVK